MDYSLLHWRGDREVLHRIKKPSLLNLSLKEEDSYIQAYRQLYAMDNSYSLLSISKRQILEVIVHNPQFDMSYKDLTATEVLILAKMWRKDEQNHPYFTCMDDSEGEVYFLQEKQNVNKGSTRTPISEIHLLKLLRDYYKKIFGGYPPASLVENKFLKEVLKQLILDYSYSRKETVERLYPGMTFKEDFVLKTVTNLLLSCHMG